MTTKTDGGSAFPCEQGHTPEGTWNQSFDPGMTVRDYFAAKAMPIVAPYFSGFDGALDVQQAAAAAYKWADAMLAERNKS